MNILNELTVKNLKRNKKRTLVTIFGIILSVALVTAITTFVSSMQGSMIEYAKENDGDYHNSAAAQRWQMDISF
jgi:putative ABC transport system permease protein